MLRALAVGVSTALILATTAVSARASGDASILLPTRSSGSVEVVGLALTPNTLLGVDRSSGGVVTAWARSANSSSSSLGSETVLSSASADTGQVVASGGRWATQVGGTVQLYDLAKKTSTVSAAAGVALLRQSGPYLLTDAGSLIDPSGGALAAEPGAYDTFGGLVLEPTADRDGVMVVDRSGGGAATITRSLAGCAVAAGRIWGDLAAVQCGAKSVQVVNFRTGSQVATTSGTLAGLGDGFAVVLQGSGLKVWRLDANDLAALPDTDEGSQVAVEGRRVAYSTAERIVVTTVDVSLSAPRLLGVVAAAKIQPSTAWTAQLDLSGPVGNGELDLSGPSGVASQAANPIAGEAIRNIAVTSGFASLGSYSYSLTNYNGDGMTVHRLDGTPGDDYAVGTVLGSVQVAQDALVSATPVIDDMTPVVGQTLTASAGTWTAGTGFAYQWFSGGTAVTSATGASYAVAAGDLGKAISVQVTGSLAGYTPVTTASASTAAVGAGTLSAGKPTISGTAALGEVLTASPGSWTAGASLAYQWLAGGAPISGATGATYTLTTAEVGKAISVQVAGSLAGYTSVTTASASTAVVASGSLVSAVPIIDDVTPAVGQTLVVSAGAWTTGTGFTYQWLSGGTAVTSATGTSYKVAAGDLGKAISVRVTGSLTGYTSVTTASAPTAAVGAGTLSAETPTISGTAAVGQVLTADPGSWSPDGVSFAYQWLADGKPLAGAKNPTFMLTTAQVGKAISVQVTGSLAGYTSLTTTSDPSAAVATVAVAAGSVSISGDAVVAATVKVDHGTWAAGVTFSYQWLANGEPIAAAKDDPTYMLTAAELGKAISVKVTGSLAGYASVTKETAKTGAVAAATLLAAKPTIYGDAVVGRELTAQPGSWTKDTAFTYQWFTGDTPIADATNFKFTVTQAQVGRTIKVQVTGSLPGYTTLMQESAPTAEVPKPALVPGSVSISGIFAVGEELTASPSDWSPGDVIFSYQWLAGGDPIPGATDPRFTLTAAERTKQVSVQVTGSLPGYLSATVTSEKTPAIADGTMTPGTVTVVGHFAVGAKQQAKATGWPSEATVSYRWLRGDDAISGATGPTYTPSKQDRGRPLAVQVTATRYGYVSVSAWSKAQTVADPIPKAATPKISGKAVVGVTLTAKPGSWTARTTFAYQWLRNGTAVPKAVKARYTLGPVDLGARITVTVTGSRSGYASVDRTSANTAKVTPAAFSKKPTPKIGGTATVTKTLTVKPGTWSPKPAGLAIQWYRGSAAIVGATSLEYTLTQLDRGQRMWVEVTASRDGYQTTRTHSAKTAVVG